MLVLGWWERKYKFGRSRQGVRSSTVTEVVRGRFEGRIKGGVGAAGQYFEAPCCE
jgi:hypothetical protein